MDERHENGEVTSAAILANPPVTADDASTKESRSWFERAHEEFELQHRARGLWERCQERQAIERRLWVEAAAMRLDYHEALMRPLSYEEWLASAVEFPHANYCSRPHLVLRQLDKWLWEYEPIPFNEDSITSYLFDWEDVLANCAAGRATSQAEWDALVESEYRAIWQKYRDWCDERWGPQSETSPS